MLKRYLPLAAALACSPLAATAAGLDLSVSDKAARAIVDFELSNNLVVDGSILHHQDRGEVYGAGLHVVGLATGGPQPVKAGLGGRLLWVNSDVGARDDGFVLPLGGWVTYVVPDYDRFTLGGSLYYAPDVLSFGDASRYTEYNFWGAYDVTRQAKVYLGVRGIEADFDGSSSQRLDTGLHVGMKLRF
jgi:hypothetical protein